MIEIKTRIREVRTEMYIKEVLHIYAHASFHVFVCCLQRGVYGERSVKAVNHYLELISKDISGLFGQMCDDYVRLNSAVSQITVCVVISLV